MTAPPDLYAVQRHYEMFANCDERAVELKYRMALELAQTIPNLVAWTLKLEDILRAYFAAVQAHDKALDRDGEEDFEEILDQAQDELHSVEDSILDLVRRFRIRPVP